MGLEAMAGHGGVRDDEGVRTKFKTWGTSSYMYIFGNQLLLIEICREAMAGHVWEVCGGVRDDEGKFRARLGDFFVHVHIWESATFDRNFAKGGNVSRYTNREILYCLHLSSVYAFIFWELHMTQTPSIFAPTLVDLQPVSKRCYLV